MSFRISDKIPTLYDAVTNEELQITNWSVGDGRTNVLVKLDANAYICRV